MTYPSATDQPDAGVVEVTSAYSDEFGKETGADDLHGKCMTCMIFLECVYRAQTSTQYFLT